VKPISENVRKLSAIGAGASRHKRDANKAYDGPAPKRAPK